MKLTLDDLEKTDGEFLDPMVVSEYLGCKPQPVRETIRNGIPWGYVIGKAKFVIPRRAFVNYHRYGGVVGTK
jgi:hypothetical protein